MRKLLPSILIGLGAFLLTMALLMKVYAVPRLAVVPLDQNSRQIVLGENSTYFDVETLTQKKGLLTTVATVIGDPEAAKEASKESGRDLAVWDKGQASDNNDAPPPMTAGTDRIVFDRFTGEAVNCCGELIDGQPGEHKGQLVKFPFFTEKKTYQYWDGTVRQALPATFTTTDTIDGLPVYVFEQDVPRAKTESREVPAKLFGLPDAPIMADRYYQNHRTFYIEPTTGVMIKLTEKQYQTLEVPGAAPFVALDTESTFSPDTVAKNVADYKTKSKLLAFINNTGPVLLGALGAALVLAGVALSILAGRRASTTAPAPGVARAATA